MTEGRGLFCDLDGTLADSLDGMYRAYEAFLAGCGIRGTRAEFASLIGPKLEEIVGILAERHRLPGSPDALLARYEAVIDAVYDDVRPNTGAHELLAAARRAGWRVAVVTSNSHRRTGAWLARTALADLVDTVVAAEPGFRGKPAPDLYMAALRRCGCGAAQSLAVEDSASGAQAALAAGLRTVVVGGAAAPAGASAARDLLGVLPLLEVER